MSIEQLLKDSANGWTAEPGAACGIHEALRRDRRRRHGAAGVAAAIVAVGAVGVVVQVAQPGTDPEPTDGMAASSDPSVARQDPSPSTSEAERLEWQTSTQDYRSELVGAAMRLKGWAGVAIAWESKTLVLYSTEEAPSSDVEEIISRHPGNLSVSWQQVDYSERDLEAAQKLLYRAFPESVGGSYRRDFSGVIVRVPRATIEDEGRMAELRQLALDTTPVPVTFAEGSVFMLF